MTKRYRWVWIGFAILLVVMGIQMLSTKRMVTFQRLPDLAQILNISSASDLARFSTTDSKQVRLRAKKVIQDAESSLGVDPNWPLQAKLVRPNPVSAQVFFQQTYQGRPVLPGGEVRVDLGPSGELLQISSAYLRDLKVTNHPILTADLAERNAREQLLQRTGKTPPQATQTHEIIWVTQGEARYAFQFQIGHRMVVVDGETGDILINRDQRRY